LENKFHLPQVGANSFAPLARSDNSSLPLPGQMCE
jgi:hypothetical protein